MKAIKSLIALLALACSVCAAAEGDELRVSFEPFEHGIRLDAGNGPQEFHCEQNRVSAELKLGSRSLNVGGTYLTITFDPVDAHISFEGHDQPRTLERNQVRLTCKDGVVLKKLGTDVIEVEP